MGVREIPAEEITKTIKRLCIEANTVLGDDVIEAYKKSYENEKSPVGRDQKKKASPCVRIPAWPWYSWIWARTFMWWMRT